MIPELENPSKHRSKIVLHPHKTGSKPGEINLADRVWTRIRYGGAFVWTVLLGCSQQIEQSIPLLQGSVPIWVVILLGGLAAAIVRWDCGGLQRSSENRPQPPV